MFWTMDVVFAMSFSSSKVVDVQRHDVHRSTAWTHVSIHAQLPSMVFSFPTNHVIPWLFKSFLCQSQRPKRSQDTEKPHRKWSQRLYVPCFTTHLFREERADSKCYFQHMTNQYLLLFQPQGTTWLRELRETKQICYSHSGCWILLSALSTCIHKRQVPYEEASAETF